MTDYVKYIDEYNIEYPPINDEERGIINYNLNIPLLIEDGYKPLITNPPEPSIRKNYIKYAEHENNIEEIVVFIETQEEAEERIARLKKGQKTYEINQKIEELEKMVTDEILFNHEENVEVYREVIQGLKDTRDAL